MSSVRGQQDAPSLQYTLVIAIGLCQRAKILLIRAHCAICLEMSWITLIYEKNWTWFDCISENYLEYSELNCSTA